MAGITKRGRWLWEEFDPQERYAGATLAALRAGVGREAGSVPGLWRYYRVVVPEQVAARGLVTRELAAEHAALALFGVHQQSQSEKMHRDAARLGVALRALRASGQFKDNPEALDRRVNAAATATSTGELVYHLRGLVTLLRGQHIALDYTRLVGDLADWTIPEARTRVRRRWGAQYYAWIERPEPEAEAEPAA